VTDTAPAADPPRLTAKELQVQRIAQQPPVYQQSHERLAYELALGIDDPLEVFARHGLTADAALALVSTEAFALLLNRTKIDVQANGLSFRAKAKIQAEELLAHSFDIAVDPLQPAAVRADLIKWTGKMADYEPKKEADDKPAGAGFSLTIQFSGAPPTQVIDNTRVIEHSGTK